MNARSSKARSCCKTLGLVALTFATLERNRSRELKHKKLNGSCLFLSWPADGRAMIARQSQMLRMSAFETGQMSSLVTKDMSAVETGPMSAAETGQTSAVETRQMSAAEIGQ